MTNTKPEGEEVKPLPCPFCGHSKPRILRMDIPFRQTRVLCARYLRCFAEGPARDNAKEAITAWNTRAELASLRSANQALAERVRELEVLRASAMRIITSYGSEGGEPDFKEYPADTCAELEARILALSAPPVAAEKSEP